MNYQYQHKSLILVILPLITTLPKTRQVPQVSYAFTQEAKFDYNSNVYLTNLTSFSKISPFKADQGNRPYFYVKNPIEKKQYSTNGKPSNGIKTNEISIYDMINQKEGNQKNKNGNGFYSKKDFDKNMNGINEKLNGFERKKVFEQNQKENFSVGKGTNRPNYINIFTNFYENMSNMHILLKNITPFIEMTIENLVKFA